MKLLVATMVILGSTGVAWADRHQVVGATVESPAGWEVQDAPDHSTMIFRAGNRFAIFVVYSPHPPIADQQAMFAADWKTSTVNTPTATVPTPTSRKVAGRTVLEAAAEATSDGSRVTVGVLLLDAGGQIVPTLIYTQDREMLKSFQPDIDRILTSVRLTTPAPVATPAPDPAPAAGAGRKLTTVTLKDIAGTWNTSDSAVTTYVDSSTGSYAGTSATFYSELYTIQPDGSYTRKFQGMANGHVIRESGKGQITLAPDAIVFTEDGGKDKKRLRFLDFTIDPDGTAHWRLLDAAYPTTLPNINLYGQKWVRAVPKPK